MLTSDTDFLAVITKIIGTKPDAVFLALVAEQSANFIIQARQQGIDPEVKFLGVPNFGSDQFILIGGKAVEGAIYVADYFAGMASEENQLRRSLPQKVQPQPRQWRGAGLHGG